MGVMTSVSRWYMACVFVSADDGAAGAGEVGGGSGSAGRMDHFQISAIDLIDFGAQIEIGVDQLLEAALIPASAGTAAFGRRNRPRSPWRR